jgi:putative redox protein
MQPTVVRELSGKMKHVVHVRNHALVVDEGAAAGGEVAGPTPHDRYDAAPGACKGLTVLWYANRKHIPVENIEVTVERDGAGERARNYRLRATLAVSGPLTGLQRPELRNFAGKCPVHKRMTQVTAEFATELAAAC